MQREGQKDLMATALELARMGCGRTYPNPAVGAVVVKNGKIVGRGFHRKPGTDHAEVEAMKDAGPRCRGADLYVTLEPCCHFGKTPPCVDAIIGSGIRRVLVPILDPNPVVNGGGVRALRRAGIAVELGLEAEASRRLNEAYLKFMESGRPFVTLKLAQTLDGKIATRTGDAKWITSKVSRRVARWMRADAQAIVVGARTVELDDPLLLSEPRRSANYVRCVLDSHLSIAPASRLARSAGRFPVIVYCAEERGLEKRRRRLEKMGVTVRPVKSVSRGMLDPGAVIADLGSMTVMHVWVEGGSAVFTSFLRAGLADKIVAFIATKLMGDGGSISVFGDLKVRKAEGCVRLKAGALECPGDDLLLALYPIPGQAATGRPARRAGVGVRRGRGARIRRGGTGV